MIISIWRYSHLALAISSFLFIAVASVTGVFLAFEPVVQKSNDYKVNGSDSITLARAVPVLKERFEGIQEIEVDDNGYVIIKYSDEKGDNRLAYVSPVTGEVLGVPKPQLPFFQWMTAFHRSLFLHETGRIIMGITALLLTLIAVSGIFLVVQRQNGWKHFFSTVEKTGFFQYYHVVFGRLSLFFILAIALTGTYLAIYRYIPPPISISTKIDEEAIKEEPKKTLSAFKAFRQTTLSRLQKLQYPFSDFPEDYYYVQLKDKEFCLNQFTGDILAEQSYTKTYQLANFSLRWHTGRSGILWALILATTSGYILFFIYSGFAITLKRKRTRPKNKFGIAEAEIVVLVGSENGSTFRFAEAVYTRLIEHGKKVYITDLDNYTIFPVATQLIVMTSTYGQGKPPSNAKKFAEKLKQHPQWQDIQYTVVGFGSRSYPHFCKFAYDIDHLLEEQSWAKEMLPVHTVNDLSPQDFSEWITEWTSLTGYQMLLPRELLTPAIRNLKKLRVVGKTPVNEENAFTIRLKAQQLKQIHSGDLLAVYPKNDHRERLYSIGKIDGEILLSVKLHEHGLGSGFIHGLEHGDTIKAKLVKNSHFRFPNEARQLIMISNGTGIAPFLGMISENWKKIPIQLYCGFRTEASFDLYRFFLNQQIDKGKLSHYHLALSREAEQKYVSHHISKNRTEVWQVLKNGGAIMICGSLSMQHDVMKVLKEVCNEHDGDAMTSFLEKGKILIDCY